MASGAGRDPVSPYATSTYNKLKYFEIFPFLLLTSGGKKPIIYISKVVTNTRERTMNDELVLLNTATGNGVTVELVEDTEDMLGLPYIVRITPHNPEKSRFFADRVKAEKYFKRMSNMTK